MSKTGAKKGRKPKSGRERAAAYRAKQRAQGLHLVQLWVRDTRSSEFRAEVRKQLRLLAKSEQEKRDQAFVESTTDWTDA
jgi:Protein  of unknown function (DUF3018)